MAHNNMQDMNYHCPGYESTLDELLSLVMLTDPNAAPTGILLSGCSGVGKSRMVRVINFVLVFVSTVESQSTTDYVVNFAGFIAGKRVFQDFLVRRHEDGGINHIGQGHPSCNIILFIGYRQMFWRAQSDDFKQ